MSTGGDKDTMYTWEEIRKHNKPDDCWVVMYGNVLDLSDYLKDHPGGADPIQDLSGYDVTSSFEATGAHGGSAKAEAAWKSRIIGKLDKTSKPPAVVRKAVAEKRPTVYSTMTYVYPAIAVVVALVAASWLELV